jgi:recombination protein RecT
MPKTFWDNPEEEKRHQEAVKNAVATSQQPNESRDPAAAVRRSITLMEQEFAKVLPDHIRPETFARVVITTLQMNPKLLGYDRTSLFAACMLAAQDGLLPDGKEAALTPFKGQVKYSPMVWGIVKKVRQSGDLASIACNMVHKNDTFRFWVDDDGEHLLHEPKTFGDRGPKVGGYAIMRFKDGARQIETMSMQEIGDVEKVSQADKGPWKGPFKGEMERKTIIRRLAKRCPMSPEVERVVQRDDDLYDFKEPAAERGLAKELNSGKEPGDTSGDQVGSLRDLSGPANGPVPHQDVQGQPEGRGVEPPADVQAASRRTAPAGVGALPGEVSDRGSDPAREGLGDQSAPVQQRRRADSSKVARDPRAN